MATTEERMQILKMVAENKITAQQAARLLAALEPERKKDARGPMDLTGSARWLRVRVTDLATGRNKVNVTLPLSLVNVTLRIGARFAPDMDSIDLDDLIDQIRSGAQGKVMDLEDAEGGERIEIYVE